MTANSDRRTETVDQPRGRDEREWEVFVRETGAKPLTHVGSVTAPDEERAHEQAETLFSDAVAVWLCPANAVHRRTDPALVPGEGA